VRRSTLEAARSTLLLLLKAIGASVEAMLCVLVRGCCRASGVEQPKSSSREASNGKPVIGPAASAHASPFPVDLLQRNALINGS